MVGSEGAVSERFSGGCVNPIETGGGEADSARTDFGHL